MDRQRGEVPEWKCPRGVGGSERSEPGGVGDGTKNSRARQSAELANNKFTPYKA